MAIKKKTKEITVEGIGDKIEKLTKLFGITPCDACKKRRDWLNKQFPSITAVEMTDDELTTFAAVKDNRVLRNDDLVFLQELYYKTFSIKSQKAICRSCPTIWRGIIEKLTKVYHIQTNIQDEEL